MNFSINRKLRKFLSLALVLIMMTTLFTGCKKDMPAPEDEPNLNLDIPGTTAAPSESQTKPSETQTEPPVVNENTGTVTSVLNIRSSPSTEATVVGTLYAGDKIEVSRREVVTGIDWAYIIAPEAGWIVMEYVEMDIPSQQPAGPDTSTPAANGNANTPDNSASTNIKGVVNANGLNIRNAPGTEDTKVQGSYNKGDVITILETKDGWGRTNKGWIKLEYVSTSSTSSNNTGSQTTTKPETKPDNKPTSIASNGNTAVIMRGVVKVNDLNLRSEGSTNGTRLGSLNYGARVEILEKDGNWGRTKDGWISLDYIYEDGTTGSKTANGVVTGDQLNIRSGPGTGYESVGSYYAGDSVKILEQFTYNGTTWGCTSKGWISMDYVDVGGTSADSNAENTDSNGNKTGTVIGNGLNIRSGAGTDYPALGTLNYGDRITILEEKKVGDTTWGKTAKGWVSMDFVSVD